MVGKYHIIKRDLFNISGELKKIDSSYFVVFNYRKSRFEIHSLAQSGGSLCVVVPHKTLDMRTIEFVRLTRRERSSQLFEQLERDNAILEKREKELASKKAEREFENTLSRFNKSRNG